MPGYADIVTADEPTQQLYRPMPPVPTPIPAPLNPSSGVGRADEARDTDDPEPTGVLRLEEIFPGAVNAPVAAAPAAPAAPTGPARDWWDPAARPRPASPAAGRSPVDPDPASPAPRGDTLTRLRTDSATVMRQAVAHGRAWLGTGDHKVIAWTAVVAAVLLITLIAFGH